MKPNQDSIISSPAVSFDTFYFPDLEPQALGIMIQIVSLSIKYADRPFDFTFYISIN